jgi:hypothetical protein
MDNESWGICKGKLITPFGEVSFHMVDALCGYPIDYTAKVHPHSIYITTPILPKKLSFPVRITCAVEGATTLAARAVNYYQERFFADENSDIAMTMRWGSPVDNSADNRPPLGNDCLRKGVGINSVELEISERKHLENLFFSFSWADKKEEKKQAIRDDLYDADNYDPSTWWRSDEWDILESMTRLLHKLLDEPMRVMVMEEIKNFPRRDDGILLLLTDAIAISEAPEFVQLYKYLAGKKLHEQEKSWRRQRWETSDQLKMYRKEKKFPSYM